MWGHHYFLYFNAFRSPKPAISFDFNSYNLNFRAIFLCELMLLGSVPSVGTKLLDLRVPETPEIKDFSCYFVSDRLDCR